MAWLNAFGETVQGDAPAGAWGARPIDNGSTRPELYGGNGTMGGGNSAGGGGAAYGSPFGGSASSAFGDLFGAFGGGGAAQQNPYAGAAQGGAVAGGGAPASGPYRTPDWLRNSALMLDQSPATQQAFFAANPQYQEDWNRIQSGGNSAFATDGSTLVRSDLNAMPADIANYYRQNPNELLANEGFGHDPTLAYMNYHGGPASIGANNKTMNISSYLQNNRWTPNGVVGANNPLMYANTPYGTGTSSLNGGGQQQGGGAGSGVIGGGISAGGMGASGGATGGVYPPQAGGSGSSYGGGSISSSGNPYLGDMANMLTQVATDNWRRQVQPQIASGAIAAGGYGGSRQAVAEANSAKDLNLGIASGLASLLGGQYNTDLQYDLGLRNNQLGWGNLGLGQQSLDRNINNDNLNWQMQGAQLGMQLQDRQLQQNQLGLGIGSQIQQTPWNNLSQYGNLYNSIGQGYGSTSQSGGGGNPLMGALGGAQLGRQIGNWWGSNNGSSPATAWYSGNQGMAD